MTSIKKSTAARVVPSFNGPAASTRPFKPVVAQLKTSVSAQGVKQPVAPPVYRPSATPKTAQLKTANGVVNKKPPVAPPAYRPLVPKVLQRKSSSSPNRTAVPKSRVASPQSAKTSIGGQTIQRAADESKNLQNLGKMWQKIAELPKASPEKAEFFEHAAEVKEKTGFSIYTVWHKHDPYVGGGKNKNYVKIVKALQGADGGKTSADQYIAWAEGRASLVTLPHALQELALIVNVAEVGRLYGDAPKKLLWFMKEVSKASLAERANLWKHFKDYNTFALTAKEDTEWKPGGDDMSDDDD